MRNIHASYNLSVNEGAVFSGGHTAEMLALASKLDPALYTPRCYVVGQTDALGRSKAAAAEKTWTADAGVKHCKFLGLETNHCLACG